MTLVEAAQGCDLLIHETLLSAETFGELTSFPAEKGRMVVNKFHTPPHAAGKVFDMVSPRMAAMWHTHVMDGYIDSVFEGMRTNYSGPATLSQDLTIFNITPGAVVARQAEVDPMQQAVVGPSDNEFVQDVAHPNPSWWADVAIDF